MAEKPRPSPQPRTDRPGELDEEEKTDPRMFVNAEYFKGKLQEALTKHDTKMTMRGWLMAFASAVVAVGAVTILAIIFIDNRVQAQTDAGVKEHENRLSTLEQQRKDDRVEMNGRMQRMEQNQNADHEIILGTSQKLDALLKAQGVPNPAPTPKDGGR
jgi:hypothetical protein